MTDQGNAATSRVKSTNAEVIEEFRSVAGNDASPDDDLPPMLLLHTIGDQPLREHLVPGHPRHQPSSTLGRGVPVGNGTGNGFTHYQE